MVENWQLDYQSLLLQNLSFKRKLAMMPQIRVKNVSEELDLARELFMNRNTKANYDRRSKISQISTDKPLDLSIMSKLNESAFDGSSAYQSFLKDKLDLQE